MTAHRINAPDTQTLGCSVDSALKFKDWLMANGYQWNGGPRIRFFFRDLHAGHWVRRKRPLPEKATETRSRSTKIDVDRASWKKISKAVADHFHNDVTYLLLDIAHGNWQRVEAKAKANPTAA
jgi:hypothetical protein